MAQQQQVLVQCMQNRLELEKRMHHLACQQLHLSKEKQNHEQQYQQRDDDEATRELQRELCRIKVESEQLRLDGLRQRKLNSILRLKLASAKEDGDLLQRNITLLDQHSQRLNKEVISLKAHLAACSQQLTEVSAAKAMGQADCAKYQSQALQTEMEVTRLREDLKLTTGRLNTATGQAAELLQQLKAVQAENASLMSQLAVSQGRDTEAAAAHKALQESLDSMRMELTSLKERLAAEGQARIAAEAAAAKATAAAEAAADALAVKEQQLLAWRDLEQASKATASQQLQLSQAQLDSMRERATAAETKLLDQIAALQQQLEQERTARCAVEASSNAAAVKASTECQSMEKELAVLQQQVAQLKAEASAANADAAAAKAAASKEAERAAALQQELEQQQERNTRAAVSAVEQLVEGLTQGQDTEDESEQPPRSQAPEAARKSAAGAEGKYRPKAAAAKKQELSDITEEDEQQTEGEVDGQQLQWARGTAANNGRRPRGAKARAQDSIRAAAAAEADAAGSAADDSGDGGRDVSHDPIPVLQQQRQTGAGGGGSRGDQGAQLPSAQPAGRQAARSSSVAAAVAAGQPPPLSFVPQTMVTPAAALQRPGVVKASAERMSAASLLKKLSQGAAGPPGKPGARKRKLAPVTGQAVDVIPPSMLMSSAFKPPKVRHMG